MRSNLLGSVFVSAIVSIISFGSGSLCAQDATADQSAEYEFRFQGRWAPPAPIPGNAHFTQIIGATHNSDGSIYAVGQRASPGVEDVAETGVIGSLVQEINAGIARGNIDTLIRGTDNFISRTEVNTFNFTANASHPRLTFLTMIAPSPDWFVGIDNLDLLDENGQWRDQIVLDLNSYDAGSENGTRFTLNNAPTLPRGFITDLDTAEPNGELFGVGSLARLTLTRVVPDPLLGDVNLDSSVDFLDISMFVGLITTGVYQVEADIDQNDTVDFLDISPFVTLLTGQ